MDEEHFEQQQPIPKKTVVSKTTTKTVAKKKTPLKSSDLTTKSENSTPTPQVIHNQDPILKYDPNNPLVAFIEPSSDASEPMMISSTFEQGQSIVRIHDSTSVHKQATKEPQIISKPRSPNNNNNNGSSFVDQTSSFSKMTSSDMERLHSVTPAAKNTPLPNMHAYYCIDHDTIHPVAPASLIIAADQKQGIFTLDQKLSAHGLATYYDQRYTLIDIPLDRPRAKILSIGKIDDPDANGAINYYSGYVPRANMEGEEKLKLFYCIDHDSMYPVPPASIVVAGNEEEAIVLLDAELATNGCKIYGASGYSFVAVSLNEPSATVLTLGAPPGFQKM